MRQGWFVVVFLVACRGEPAPVVEVVEVVAPAPGVGPVGPGAEVEVAAPEVADGKVGVAACDAYLAAYRGCIDTLGPELRASHTRVVTQLEASWKQARADERAGGSLDGTCVSARAASKLSLPTCAW